MPNSGVKNCSVCGRTLPLDEFHLFALGKYGRQSECKSCACARVHDYSEDHREERAAYTRNYQQEHREERRSYRQRYGVLNRVKLNASLKNWRINNPQKFKIKSAADRSSRRAREANADGFHSSKDVLDQYNRQGGLCYWCGNSLSKDYHVDHIIPLSRGGSNWPENLAISCPTCNLSKGSKLPDEWRLNHG